MTDILRELGPLFLGSRLKRLGERMQGDVLRIVERTGLPIQPGQYPVLAALDRLGPLTVSELVDVTGVSQPAVTRSLARLLDLGLVESNRLHRDQRHKTIALTQAGAQAVARSKLEVWPLVEAAAIDVCSGLRGDFLDQLGAIEESMARTPLDRRVPPVPSPGLRIKPFTDDLAGAFYDINAQWIGQMFRLEQTDRDVLENPRSTIIDQGGDILFVEAEGLGVVGACALQKTGECAYELTKMGVLESARGRKAGEFLLRAVLERARELHASELYLLTNAACASAIHLYEKLGFVHDADIMRRYGVRYERCNVAMRLKT